MLPATCPALERATACAWASMAAACPGSMVVTTTGGSQSISMRTDGAALRGINIRLAPQLTAQVRNGLDCRSSPIVLIGPWPQMNE